MEIKDSNINIAEITNGLDFNFDAKGKSNTSSDRNVYKYGNYTGTLTGYFTITAIDISSMSASLDKYIVKYNKIVSDFMSCH